MNKYLLKMGDYSLTNAQLMHCGKLAMPEGLKELMSDISREVLRAQPQHLYRFIARYLSALLVTRENISVSCQVCGDVCRNICHRALIEELKATGFNDTDAETATNIITKYFANGGYKESSLMMKLLKETDLEKHQIPEIRAAIEATFKRQKIKNILQYESNLVEDDITRAVDHTMKIYDQASPTEEHCHKMAQKIQTAYRAYGVRRHKSNVLSKPQRSESDISCSCLPSKLSKIRGSVEMIKFNLASESEFQSSSGSSTCSSVQSVTKEIAETVEVEHATVDYTIKGSVEVAKPIVFDKTSTEDLNICEIKKSYKSLETSNFDEEASFAEDDSNSYTEDEIMMVESFGDEYVEDYVTSQNLNDKNENDSKSLQNSNLSVKSEHTEYAICEHDECVLTQSEEEILNEKEDEVSHQDKMNVEVENDSLSKTSQRKSKLSSKPYIIMDNQLNVIDETDSGAVDAMTDSARAFYNEMTHFDDIVEDSKIVDKVIGETRNSVHSISKTNEDNTSADYGSQDSGNSDTDDD